MKRLKFIRKLMLDHRHRQYKVLSEPQDRRGEHGFLEYGTSTPILFVWIGLVIKPDN